MRIILDTNLWISFLISSKYDHLDSLIFDKVMKSNKMQGKGI